MFKARIADDFAADGCAIWLYTEWEQGKRNVLHFSPDGASGRNGMQWEATEPGALVPPTMKLPDDAARVLLDALLRHYQGASDMHTVRADLLHERGRADKLTDAVIRIAENRGQGAQGLRP